MPDPAARCASRRRRAVGVRVRPARPEHRLRRERVTTARGAYVYKTTDGGAPLAADRSARDGLDERHPLADRRPAASRNPLRGHRHSRLQDRRRWPQLAALQPGAVPTARGQRVCYPRWRETVLRETAVRHAGNDQLEPQQRLGPRRRGRPVQQQRRLFGRRRGSQEHRRRPHLEDRASAVPDAVARASRGSRSPRPVPSRSTRSLTLLHRAHRDLQVDQRRQDVARRPAAAPRSSPTPAAGTAPTHSRRPANPQTSTRQSAIRC